MKETYIIKVTYENDVARDAEHLQQFFEASIEEGIKRFCGKGKLLSIEVVR